MSRPTTTGLLNFSKQNATKTATQHNIHKGTMALLAAAQKRKTKMVGPGRRRHDQKLFDCLEEYPQDRRLVKLNEFMDVTSKESSKKATGTGAAGVVEEENASMIALSSLAATAKFHRIRSSLNVSLPWTEFPYHLCVGLTRLVTTILGTIP